MILNLLQIKKASIIGRRAEIFLVLSLQLIESVRIFYALASFLHQIFDENEDIALKKQLAPDWSGRSYYYTDQERETT